MSDEVEDSAHVEQMPVAVRFVDSNRKIHEEFLGYIMLPEGLSVKQIATSILSTVKELGLDMRKCRAQTYDGAANMSSKCIGAAKLFRNDYPKAIYIHCTSHQLNPCVAKSCSIQPAHNMIANVKRVNEYFDKSPKRLQFFRRNLKESLLEVPYTRIEDVCRTCWVERIDGLDRFEDIFGVILSVLTMIKNNEGELQEEEDRQYEWNRASRSDADDRKPQFRIHHGIDCNETYFRIYQARKCLTSAPGNGHCKDIRNDRLISRNHSRCSSSLQLPKKCLRASQHVPRIRFVS
eukprot:Seg1902.6 transcript_id=Seg1902.6/GoldUCD/mRNA.D3Y31 product="52 kDa repressor of the inhibitor of the protein kinase" protein_id=Seg1902.6/GoldUCD/D3Y31